MAEHSPKPIQPIEHERMQSVVHHIIQVGATQARHDYSVDSLRQKETGYGGDPTRQWDRALTVLFTHHWHRKVLPQVFSAPEVVNLTETEAELRNSASERIVDNRFIMAVDKSLTTIVTQTGEKTDVMIKNAKQGVEGQNVKELVEELEDEQKYRKEQNDRRAVDNISLLIQRGVGQTRAEVLAILYASVHFSEQNGKPITAREASRRIEESFPSYVRPLLRMSTPEFDKLRRATRVVRRHYDSGFEYLSDEIQAGKFGIANDRIFVVDSNDQPRDFHQDPSTQDAKGCPAGYPISMTNEAYPGEEAHNTSPARDLTLKFADIVRYLKVKPLL